jgi:hypothetical protein
MDGLGFEVERQNKFHEQEMGMASKHHKTFTHGLGLKCTGYGG